MLFMNTFFHLFRLFQTPSMTWGIILPIALTVLHLYHMAILQDRHVSLEAVIPPLSVCSLQLGTLPRLPLLLGLHNQSHQHPRNLGFPFYILLSSYTNLVIDHPCFLLPWCIALWGVIHRHLQANNHNNKLNLGVAGEGVGGGNSRNRAYREFVWVCLHNYNSHMTCYIYQISPDQWHWLTSREASSWSKSSTVSL